jgi:hypothetical protein
MACNLRGLWIFKTDADVSLLTSRRFVLVERRLEKLHGASYSPLPTDEQISSYFASEILREKEEEYIPPEVPPVFQEDFAHGSFHWDWEHEKCVEKLWPMGPVCALGNGRIWPVLFLYKKGYYLVTIVALERQVPVDKARVLALPEITAAFAVLQDVCEFLPEDLSISDVNGISNVQYHIKAALPFGSPVMMSMNILSRIRAGAVADETTVRVPAWKPFLYKGKPRLAVSLVETVSGTIYGKPEHNDECFISGHVYCCADIPGVPEITVSCRLQFFRFWR